MLKVTFFLPNTLSDSNYKPRTVACKAGVLNHYSTTATRAARASNI